MAPMRKRSALITGVLTGLAATGTLADVGRYAREPGSDKSRMRGDVSRVGADFWSVIQRENENAQEHPAGQGPSKAG